MLQLLNRYVSRPYESSDLEIVIDLLVDSYKTMNPILSLDWVDRDQLRSDFRSQIVNKVYPYGFVLEERETKELVACGFICPLNTISIQEHCDLRQVPSKKDIPRYLRDTLLIQILQRGRLNLETACVGSLLAAKQNHTGQTLGLIMFYHLAQMSLAQGFDVTIGNIVNDKVKHIIRRYLSYKKFSEIDLKDLYVLDTAEQPLKGVIQEGGFIYNSETIAKVQHFLSKLEAQPITLKMSKL